MYANSFYVYNYLININIYVCYYLKKLHIKRLTVILTI